MSVPPDRREADYDRFVGLFAGRERPVRAFVRSLLPTVHDADEVMQEVGLACWRKFDDFAGDSPDEFVRWACVVARFEVLRYRRGKARDRLVLSDEAITRLAARAEERLGRAEAERAAVGRCLDRLSGEERRLLLSVHTPGDSVAAVAAETGQKARRLYDAVARLRDRVGRCVRSQLEPEAA